MIRTLCLGLVAVLVPTVVSAGEKEDLAGQAWVVLEKATRSGDMLARARAIAALPRLPGHDIDAYLKEAFKDPQWPVRKAAIKVLVARNDADARKAAADALRDVGVPVEEDAFDVLSTMKPAEARAAFVAAVTDPATPTRDRLMTAAFGADRATLEAVFAAGLAKGDAFFAAKLGDVRREDRVALAEMLLKEKDPKVLAAVLKHLLERGDKVAPAVLKGLLKSADPDVRYGAAELLAAGGDASAVKVLLPLADGDAAAQLRFLKAAAAAPSEENLPRLKKYLSPETPVDLLVWVYRAFAGSTDEEVRKRVEGDLNSTTMPKRAAAARSIGRLLGTRAIPKLNQLLVDGSPLIRQLAAESLGELGQAESVEVLERCLRDTERDVRFAVIKALSKIHDKAVIGVASFVIYDTDPEIRKTAILAICNVNHESAMPILRISIEDADPEIRFAVVRAMTYLDPAQSLSYFERALAGLRPDDLVSLAETFKTAFLPFLKKAAESDRAWARQGALRGIAVLPDQESTFLKEIAATNPYADVRKGALARLEALSCADAVDVASAVWTDKDPEVRIAAIETTVRCGDNSTLDKVKAALLDLEENVRVAAAVGLLSYPKAGGKKAAPAPKGKK